MINGQTKDNILAAKFNQLNGTVKSKYSNVLFHFRDPLLAESECYATLASSKFTLAESMSILVKIIRSLKQVPVPTMHVNPWDTAGK